ncbi:MAG: hypothetical protein H7301_02740 [Cryobacterium sp.]|nr:hypothetical protein [Oligoflexia bacterium]
MKLSNRYLVMFLALVSASTFAAEDPILYVCHPAGGSDSYAQLADAVLTVSMTENSDTYLASVLSTNARNPGEKIHLISATVLRTELSDAVSFHGQGLADEVFSMSIVKDPSVGTPGLLTPNYTATVSFGIYEDVEWSCTSPIDPQ